MKYIHMLFLLMVSMHIQASEEEPVFIPDPNFDCLVALEPGARYLDPNFGPIRVALPRKSKKTQHTGKNNGKKKQSADKK